MEKVYVFGHMNPDTDSVCAAINLANLKRNLGVQAEERVLGPINKETKFVLDYFKVKEPKYLNDVKLRIKDIKYRKNCYLSEYTSIKDVYDYMLKVNTTAVSIVDEDKHLVNLITAKDILKRILYPQDDYLRTSYDNILSTLNGEKIVHIDDEIEGKVTAASFAHSTFESKIELGREDILIVGDRHYIIELGIKSKVKLIIIIGNSEIKKEHIKEAKKNKVNIIRTGLKSFETARLIVYSNYIKNILNKKEPYYVQTKDYYDDFIKWSAPLKIDSFPVIDKNGKCMGLLRKSEIDKLNKRKVILVDHNEPEQSAIGLEEAEIVEVVDHHRIGRVSTNQPINFRNMTVGSTNTIIYYLYLENGVKISKETAGLMMSGIISDTLFFKSPTTTETDKKVVKVLSKICKVKPEKYALEMFKAGTSLEGLSKEEIVSGDLKTFDADSLKVTVSQVFTMDYESILSSIDEYLDVIEHEKQESRVDHFVFVVTDIIKNGSYILFDKNSLELVGRAFRKKNISEGFFVDGVVSRKKQIVPSIIDALEN